jgi:serine protease
MLKAAVGLVVTFVLGFSAGAAEIRPAKSPVSEQYIVVLKDSTVRPGNAPGGGPTVGMMASDLATRYGAERMLHVYESALKGFAVRMPAARAKLLAGDPNVAYVEEDGEVHAIATQSNATWGLDRIDQRSLPLGGTYTYDQTGSGVRAYIVDTGIRLGHTDFGGRAVFGFDAFGGNGNDGNGHGTHVAGTVGGTVYGVAKNVTLVAVRVLDNNGSGTNSGVIAGVDWVTANHVKPAVANMSLGGGASSALDTAVNNSINAGVTYVLASGNENADACNSSPARVAAAITVNSSTSSDARSSFSNWGSCTDIFAPGSSITSAWYTSNTATNTISGTSMASPHVAGAAALYLQSNPGATPATVWGAIRDSSTANAISGVNGSPNLLLYSLLTTTTTYSIAGNAGTSGATVTAGGVSTTSDASGSYTIANLEAGTYTVTPSKTGCTFSPTSQSVTVGPSATGRNFTATCSTGDTALTSGVTLTGQSVAKSAWNYYYIDVPSGATSLTFATTSASGDVDIYTQFNAKPTSSSYICRPYTSSGNETCTATNPSAGRWWLGVYGYAAASYSVTATVQTAVVTYSIAGSAGTSGATVTAGSRSATSDTSGNYTITGLAAGTYSVTASKTGCTFSPTSISVTVGPNATGKSFTASCSTAQVERLANGGFETLTASTNTAPDGSWSRTAYTGTSFNTLIANGSAPRTGTDYAYMGVYNSASQTVTSANAVIPAAATSATLTLYVSIVTSETTTTTAYDKLNVQLVDASNGSVLATLGTLSNLNKTASSTTYVLRSYSVTSYKGKTVRVRFAATTDSSALTYFRIDDVSLKSDG